jgi:hypothetical protein
MTLARSLAIWGLMTLAILLVGITRPVWAADGTVVDFSPFAALLREYAGVFVDAILAAALGWAIRFLHLSGNAKAEAVAAQLRDFLHGTADRAIDRAMATIAGPISSVTIQSDIIAAALVYVQANARDAVKRLDASPDDLRRLLEAKLSLRTGVPAGGLAGPAGALAPA